jgi:hypothetical protein
MTVFKLRSAHCRDHDGRKWFAGQWEDAIMPVATAQRALRHGVAVPVTDPKRAHLGGARRRLQPAGARCRRSRRHRGAEGRAAIQPDPVLREANFTVIDRSAEARTLTIEMPRL